MFEEFGQAPLSLELDLETYEGPSYHVTKFRGRTGWLMAARATIQSEHDLLSAKLLVACDESEEPILPHRTATLSQCGWRNLTYCDDQPPEILEELLCEEEGALYARWQRNMNKDLAVLAERVQQQIEQLEARAKARERIVERQLADLRRRRWMSTSVEHRIALANIMTDIEAENDLAIGQLAEQRQALRRRAEAYEESLWQRTDVLIEVEPLFIVRWTCPTVRAHQRSRRGAYFQPDTDYTAAAAFHYLHASAYEPTGRRPAFGLSREWVREPPSLGLLEDAAILGSLPPPLPSTKNRAPSASVTPASEDVAWETAREKVAERSDPTQVQSRGVQTQDRSRKDQLRQLVRMRRKLKEQIAHLRSEIDKISQQKAQGLTPRTRTISLIREFRRAVAYQHNALAFQISELRKSGINLRATVPEVPDFPRGSATELASEGSKSAAANQAAISDRGSPPISPALFDQRQTLQAELRQLERRGARAFDGKDRFTLYRQKRDILIEQISRINMKIAAVDRQEPSEAASTAKTSEISRTTTSEIWTPERVEQLRSLWEAVAIIRMMEDVAEYSDYVFPSFNPKKPLSENAINGALKRLGYGGIMTAHGFRTSASSLLNESGEFHPDAIERALAHQDSNSVRAAYNRTQYWDERVRMMQWWSDKLDSLKRLNTAE